MEEVKIVQQNDKDINVTGSLHFELLNEEAKKQNNNNLNYLNKHIAKNLNSLSDDNIRSIEEKQVESDEK
jgi:hypothetical protein